MKLSLEVVKFDSSVAGPGPRAEAHHSETFAVDQKSYKVLIEYDSDLGCVRLVHPTATYRDVVLVPIERVVSMEPLPSKKAPTKAA